MKMVVEVGSSSQFLHIDRREFSEVTILLRAGSKRIRSMGGSKWPRASQIVGLSGGGQMGIILPRSSASFRLTQNAMVVKRAKKVFGKWSPVQTDMGLAMARADPSKLEMAFR